MHTLQDLIKNKWGCMSSCAAVMARPFNSVTNLLFLRKPQIINHSAQSGDLAPKVQHQFPPSSGRARAAVWDELPLGAVLCSAGFKGSEGEVTNFAQ